MRNQSIMVPVVAEQPRSDDQSVQSGSVSSSRRRQPPPSDVYSPARLLRRRMIAISIVGLGGIAALLIALYAGTGSIFLYWDYLKGGHECSKTSGFKVWMYCLVNICFIPANVNSMRATYKTHHTKLRIFSLIVNFFIELAFVVYGNFVLFTPGPCQKFKHDARLLWIWAKFAFAVKIFTTVVVGLVIIALTIYYIYKHILHRRAQHEEENLGDIPLAEAELRTNELRVEFVENNPEPEIAEHPVFRPTPRMTQADAIARPSSLGPYAQSEPLLAESYEDMYHDSRA